MRVYRSDLKQTGIQFTNPDATHVASGFTLIELLTAIAIVGLLATLAVPMIEPMRARAGRLVCMANLRSLHVSMSAYLSDHKSWPQSDPEANDVEFDNFWLASMEPYGVTEKGWLCPTIARMTQHDRLKKSEMEQASRLHYLPTDFDAKPITPHKFPTHPWFMETGGPHGRGNLIIRGDGSLRELQDLIEEIEGAAK